MEVCGSGSLDAATNLIGVTNQSLSCPSFCHGGQGRAQAVLQQCLADAAAARERCRTILSRWTIGVSCLPYEGIVFSPWGIFSPVSVHHQPGGSGQQPGQQPGRQSRRAAAHHGQARAAEPGEPGLPRGGAGPAPARLREAFKIKNVA